MNQHQVLNLVKVLIGFIITLLSLSGFAGYGYNFKEKKFHFSRPMFTYTILVTIAFTMVYFQELVNDLATKQFDIRSPGKLYFYLNILSAIVCFFNSLIVTNYSIQFLNTVRLFETLIFFQVNEAIIKSTIFIIALKVIAIPVALETTLILRQSRDQPEKHLLWTLYYLLPWIVASIIPHCFFGALVVHKQMTLVLNGELQRISQEVNCMQTKLQLQLQKPYYRMQRLCDLADRLDVLAIKYTLIETQVLDFLGLLSAPFLCSLLCNVFGIAADLFTYYHAIADTLINNADYDTFEAVTNSVFLIVSITEIGLQAHFSNESILVAKQTGYILQRINLLHADIRFKQSVEAFSLTVFSRRYKIQPWGMLEIDISLLHDVLSAVTTFLLILIQSDLTLRFSLQ